MKIKIYRVKGKQYPSDVEARLQAAFPTAEISVSKESYEHTSAGCREYVIEGGSEGFEYFEEMNRVAAALRN